MTNTPKTMKVTATITFEIDVEAYTLEYGIEGVRAIREDVKAYARAAVISQLDSVGVLA